MSFNNANSMSSLPLAHLHHPFADSPTQGPIGVSGHPIDRENAADLPGHSVHYIYYTEDGRGMVRAVYDPTSPPIQHTQAVGHPSGSLASSSNSLASFSPIHYVQIPNFATSTSQDTPSMRTPNTLNLSTPPTTGLVHGAYTQDVTWSHPAAPLRQYVVDGTPSLISLPNSSNQQDTRYSYGSGSQVPSTPGPHEEQPTASHLPRSGSASPSPAILQHFVDTSFPLQTYSHVQKREALAIVMTSPWKLMNVFEPSEDLLLQFTSYDQDQERWCCSFWKDGKPCESSCKKKDHAKGHIRVHIQHLPYACQEPCPRTGAACNKRYPASEPLNKHRNPKIQCPYCGISMLQGNLQRHREESCRGQRVSEGSETGFLDTEDI